MREMRATEWSRLCDSHQRGASPHSIGVGRPPLARQARTAGAMKLIFVFSGIGNRRTLRYSLAPYVQIRFLRRERRSQPMAPPSPSEVKLGWFPLADSSHQFCDRWRCHRHIGRFELIVDTPCTNLTDREMTPFEVHLTRLRGMWQQMRHSINSRHRNFVSILEGFHKSFLQF